MLVETPPPGSRLLPPLQQGDQGVSAAERPQAQTAMRSLLRAGGVNWVVTWNQASGLYELVGKDGTIRWERWAAPDGQLVYRIHSIEGRNPISSMDPTAYRTLAEETAAAGGAGKPIPESIASYPDIFQRMTQLFDSRRAPDFVYVPTGGADLNHPGAGSHGIPDITQSRAPLIIAGPGVARGAVSEQLVKNVDVAPTVAQLLGVRPVVGRNASGVPRMQMLRWQDGTSLASSIADARAGANPWGTAQRALMFVLDGASQPVLMDEIAKGNLPNIARIMRGGTTFRNGSISDYPTVTWANHNTLTTGASPGHQGLLNNSWYDRATGRERLVTDGGFMNTVRTGKDMDPQVETLYEAVRRSFGRDAVTMAINQPSGRGATISTLDVAGFGHLLSNLWGIGRRFLDGRKTIQDSRFMGDPEYRKASQFDNLASAIGAAMYAKGSPPKLAIFELGLTDNQGHIKGPDTAESRATMHEADRNVGRILAELERRNLLQSSLLVVTADHGMEHQYTEPSKLGGWFDALRTSGVKVVESTRFVYVRNVRWSVHGEQPRVGASSSLAVRVINDDVNEQGFRPAVAGALIVVRDQLGNRWTGHTDGSGVARVAVAPVPGGGPLEIEIVHPAFSKERGRIDVAGDDGAPHAVAASVKRSRRRRR